MFPALCAALRGWLQRAAREVEAAGIRGPLEAARWAFKAARLLHPHGMYTGAERLYRKTLEMEKRALGPEHGGTLESVTNLAVVLSN